MATTLVDICGSWFNSDQSTTASQRYMGLAELKNQGLAIDLGLYIYSYRYSTVCPAHNTLVLEVIASAFNLAQDKWSQHKLMMIILLSTSLYNVCIDSEVVTQVITR